MLQFFVEKILIVCYNNTTFGEMKMSNNNIRRKYKQKIRIKINKKKLIKRTQRKIKKKRIKRIKLQAKRKILKESNFNKKTNELIYTAPKEFSIINNPNENIKYFNKIIKIIKNKYYEKVTINFDIENIEDITIDAVMYMLAIVTNTKVKHNSKGSIPIKKNIKRSFIESGFLNYVNTNKQVVIPRNQNKIQIKMSADSNNIRDVCKEIIEFVIGKFKIERKKINFLYGMLYEIMLNTTEHAYNETDLLKYWYLYVEVDTTKVKISLLDTGEGIPKTVNRKYYENIKIFNLNNDGEIIISAFNGKFRSQTKKNWRNKGMPKVLKYISQENIDNFKVISGNYLVSYSKNSNKFVSLKLEHEFIGTLYYWEVDILKYKEMIK